MSSLAAMRALLEKYVEMRAMRLEDSHHPAHDPSARMRALAARFPGALREIDALPLEVIEARIAELEAARGTSAPRWAQQMAEYHAWMRAALALRRAAGPTRDRALALAWIERHEHELPHEMLRGALDGVLRPPRGRLNQWVFACLARAHGESPAAIEARLFGAPRR